ncbi:MAG: PspA/IM30 family protein [Bacillota bacterium]
MRFFYRVKNIFSAKLEKQLDSLEDPKEMLDYSIIQMEKSLRDITKNALEIGTAKTRLEMQKDFYETNIKRHEESARLALQSGQEEAAKAILLKKISDERQLQRLHNQIDALKNNLESITKSKKELQYKIELYRWSKEELKAEYDAFKAQIKIKEVMTNIGEDSKSIYGIVDRAENKIRNIKAKVKALEELSTVGIIDEMQILNMNINTSGGLPNLTEQKIIEEQLAKIKNELND